MWFRDYIETIEIISGSTHSIPEKFGTIIGHQMNYKHCFELSSLFAKNNKENLLYKTHFHLSKKGFVQKMICPKEDLSNKGFVQ